MTSIYLARQQFSYLGGPVMVVTSDEDICHLADIPLPA